MLLDVRPDHLQIVQDILQKHVPQYEVWAFGSRAKWTAKEYSDLDLCIVSDKPLSFSVLGAMEEDFSESDLPWKVDVVDWATTSPSFRKIIERDKVAVRELSDGVGMKYSNTTIDSVTLRVTKGTTPTTIGGRFTDSGINFVKVESITADGRIEPGKLAYIDQETDNLLARSRLQLDDILFSIAGTIGRVSKVSQSLLPANTNQAVAIIRPDKAKIVPDYLVYLLRNQTIQQSVHEGVVQAVQANFSLGSIRALQIPLPTLVEQERLVGPLVVLDDKITLLRETNATLEAIAQAIFKSWFVDFDPVRAKMEGREPEGMDAETAALFPDSFEDSELGEIPSGWQAMPLADACEINPTRRLTKSKQAPYLEMSALPTQGHRTDTPISRAFSSGTKFINGDTLLARITPCLENGKTAFVDCLLEDEVGWGSTEYIVLHPKAPLPSYWAYLLSRHEPFRQFAIQAMVGTSGRQRVEVSRIAQYLVAVPDERVSVVFAELVEPLQRSIAANDDSAKSLAMLRDTLLPRLMSGKIVASDGNNYCEGRI